MATAVSERAATKTRLGKQHTAEGFTTKASMKNVTVNLNAPQFIEWIVIAFLFDDKIGCWSSQGWGIQGETSQANLIQKVL